MRRPIWIGGSLVLAVAVLVTTALVWADSDSGRAWIATRLESFVSDQIAGQMRIGGIDRIWLDRVDAHDVRFFTPGGELVLRVRRVELDVRVLDLFRGRIATDGGRVHGGVIHLATDANEHLGLDRAFRSQPGSAPSGFVIDLRQIAVSNVTLRVRATGVPDTRVTRLSCVVRVWTPEPGASVKLRASNVVAHVAASTPAPITLVLARGTVRFDGASAERARVDVGGTMGGSRMRLLTTVTMAGERARIVARLTVDGALGWIRSIPFIFQATVADLTSSSFDLRVRSAEL